jgi:RNA polymerase sigma factor (sigma-70 family)
MSTPAAHPDVGRIRDDPDAFEVFYRTHLETVQRFVARRVSDPHLAADLTADVFLAAVDGAGGYRPDRGSPAGWLVGVARHTIAAEFRRQARSRELVRRVSGRRHLDADALSRIEERIDAEREARNVFAAIADLPRRDRAVLELVAVDGLSIGDAAQALGLPPGTARVRLHRARKRLNQLLSPTLKEIAP